MYWRKVLLRSLIVGKELDNKQKNIENLLKFKIYMHKNPNEFGENSN